MNNLFNNLGQPIGQPIPDWQPPPRPRNHSIDGRYCRLEPLRDAHAADLFEAFGQNPDPRDWTYLPYGPFVAFADFLIWVQSVTQANDPLFFAIIDIDRNRPVGVSSYLRIAPDAGSIEVGHIHYSPLLQRTPAATEAMYLMMQQVFDELGYRRYEWKCDSLNSRSRRAAERLGFRFEGEFRQAAVYKGRNRDTAWYSIIDREWPALKAAFTAWLAPENFDSLVRQLKSLETMRNRTPA